MVLHIQQVQEFTTHECTLSSFNTRVDQQQLVCSPTIVWGCKQLNDNTSLFTKLSGEVKKADLTEHLNPYDTELTKL